MVAAKECDNGCGCKCSDANLPWLQFAGWLAAVDLVLVIAVCWMLKGSYKKSRKKWPKDPAVSLECWHRVESLECPCYTREQAALRD